MQLGDVEYLPGSLLERKLEYGYDLDRGPGNTRSEALRTTETSLGTLVP